MSIIAQLRPPDAEPETGADEEQGDKYRDRRAVATQIVELITSMATELCHDRDGVPYLRFGSVPHIETWQLDSRTAQEWMAHLYYRQNGSVPRAQALADATATMAGLARYEGPQRDVHLRCAFVDDAAVHDLGDAQWRAVTITSATWSVGPSPVIFRRPSAARAIPEPVRGAPISDVIDRLDLPARDARHVIVWVISSIIGDVSVPVLELSGPAGSGKTTLLRRIRSMVDPCDAEARASPRSVEDLYVAARHSYVVAADNLSHIDNGMSDALCILCTGGGYARRTLYTSDEETVLRARRPIIITAVTPVITASDLLDRTVAINLLVLDDVNRETEAALTKEWTDALPVTMGALYDLIAAVLRVRPSIRLTAPPRMADFSVIGEAISRICGWPSYVEEYAAHRRELAARSVKSSPVAAALLELMRVRDGYAGPIGAIGAELARRWRTDSDAWPRSPRGVGDALRRAAPGLASAGVNIAWDPVRHSDGYHVKVSRGPAWSA
jgi:hypothetical protein